MSNIKTGDKVLVEMTVTGFDGDYPNLVAVQNRNADTVWILLDDIKDKTCTH